MAITSFIPFMNKHGGNRNIATNQIAEDGGPKHLPRVVINDADGNEVSIGSAAVTPKYAAISAGSSGDNTLVAAVVGKKIRVLSYVIVVGGAVDVRFEDGAGGSALSGVMEFDGKGQGISAAYNPLGHFETTANTLLNLELSADEGVNGHLTYIEV